MEVNNLFRTALALHKIGKIDEAEILYEKILKKNAKHNDSLHLLGVIKSQNNQHLQAINLIEKAIQINDKNAGYYNNLAIAYLKINNINKSILNFNKSIEINSKDPNTYNNLGNAYKKFGNYKDALKHYDKALEINSSLTEAMINRANLYRELKKYSDAIYNYSNAYKLNSKAKYLLGYLMYCKNSICSWNEDLELKVILEKQILQIEKVSNPNITLSIFDSLKLQKLSSEIWAEDNKNIKQIDNQFPCLINLDKKKKIRLGYFSADFKEHAVAYLTAEMFELHDRQNFEVIAFSFTDSPNDQMQSRLKKGFDQFFDVSHISDIEVRNLARELDIDIAVDLSGYTKNARTGIFAHRAAPIQLSYIGYLGTMGASYYDYLIADSTLIPKENQQYYTEKIVYLPSYQVNDRKRKISDKKFTKSELNIAEEFFVFCCFNNNYKITPSTFDGWMRILKAVDKSVLFLYAENQWAQANLIKEAQIRGVNPDRLIFGQKISRAEYLARYRVADLFLDTLPYNAGTTASDALWAGLPVLTLMGESFAARVAASLLNAIEMPELITRTQEEYEAKAIELAKNPALLGQLKQKLARNRLNTPLFDTPLFTRHIEAAYKEMYARYQDDLLPDHIYVTKKLDAFQLPINAHLNQNLSEPKMTTLKIDNKEYDLDTLSDECKDQLASIQFVEQELVRLQAKAAALQTAKAAYLQALKNSLPVVGGSDTIKLS